MTTAMEIIECLPGDVQFDLFTTVVANIYPRRAPRLLQKEQINGRYLVTCLVALKGGLPAGRMCVYNNPFISHEDKPVLIFGNFECADEQAVCNMLLDRLRRIASDMDKFYILGPMNGSTWDEYRVALNSVDKPFASDILSHPYYRRLLSNGGCSISEKYYSCISDVKVDLQPDEQHAAYLKDNDIYIRNIRIDDLEQELRSVYELSSRAFSRNVFYSPVDETAFVEKYTAMQTFLDPDFVFLAEQAGKLVAFLLCYPDVLQPLEKRLIVKTIAKSPSCNVKGLIDRMILLMQIQAGRKGYGKLIHAFIHEHNRSLLISNKYDGSVFREYALMIKEVTA